MDVVVTVPKSFGLLNWIEEGDPAGSRWSGCEWHFYLGTRKPNIQPGERVYVVCNNLVRGYAPLVYVDSHTDAMYWDGPMQTRYALVRCGDAVAVTIPQQVKGFRGFRYRWWDREDEIPFPDWQNPNAQMPKRETPR